MDVSLCLLPSWGCPTETNPQTSVRLGHWDERRRAEFEDGLSFGRVVWLSLTLGQEKAPRAGAKEPGLLAFLEHRCFCQESFWDFWKRWQPEGPHGWTQERPKARQEFKAAGPSRSYHTGRPCCIGLPRLRRDPESSAQGWALAHLSVKAL